MAQSRWSRTFRGRDLLQIPPGEMPDRIALDLIPLGDVEWMEGSFLFGGSSMIRIKYLFAGNQFDPQLAQGFPWSHILTIVVAWGDPYLEELVTLGLNTPRSILTDIAIRTVDQLAWFRPIGKGDWKYRLALTPELLSPEEQERRGTAVILRTTQLRTAIRISDLIGGPGGPRDIFVDLTDFWLVFQSGVPRG